MELRRRLGVLALLLCLAHAGSDATSSRSAEEYWRSIWPDTSLPKNLEYLLESGRDSDAQKKDTQYPYTSFFEDDLHAGKQVNIIFNSPYADKKQKSNIDDMETDAEKSTSTQPWGVIRWRKTDTMKEDSEKSTSAQSWGVIRWRKTDTMEEDSEKSTSAQPWGVIGWRKADTMEEDSEKSTSTQPWGVIGWRKTDTMEEDSEKSTSTHPWGVIRWRKRHTMNEDSDKSASTQPWGVGSWKRDTMNENSEKLASTQPWGLSLWKRNMVNEGSDKSASTQPWGVGSWGRKKMKEYSEGSASTQPWGVGSWKRNTVSENLEKSTSHQPWGVGSWKQNLRSEGSDKSASTQPWGVGSWKRKPTMANDLENLSLEAICDAKERFVGEDDKFCAKSVDSLLDFVTSKLGKDIEALTSSFVPHQTQYKILDGVQRVSSEGVMCHKLNFEKPVFYCHQVNATITYIVPMEAADGTKTTIVALCHRDTRGLDPHKLFHELKVKPGTVPVCHFLGSGAISWISRNNELKAAYQAS